jgi:hypothetical protein
MLFCFSLMPQITQRPTSQLIDTINAACPSITVILYAAGYLALTKVAHAASLISCHMQRAHRHKACTKHVSARLTITLTCTNIKAGGTHGHGHQACMRWHTHHIQQQQQQQQLWDTAGCTLDTKEAPSIKHIQADIKQQVGGPAA